MNTDKYSREQLSCLKLIGFSYLQGVKRNEQKVQICSNFSPVSIPSSLARQDVPLCARPWEYFRRLGVRFARGLSLILRPLADVSPAPTG